MTVESRYTPTYTYPSSSSHSSTMPGRARSVSFETKPVYSRQPYDDEIHVMKTFSRHANRCEQCKNPYQVHLAAETLCDKGHQRALDVAQYVYNRDGQAYSMVDREGHERVQLEIPTGCEPVRLLLRAMERGLRLIRTAEAAPVSCDRTYYVAPRRSASEKKKESSSKDSSKPSRRQRAATTVERPSSRSSRSSSTSSNASSSSSTSSTSSSSSSSKKGHKHHASESTDYAKPRRSQSTKHRTRDEHAQAWPRGGAVYYAPRQSVYEPHAAPVEGYGSGKNGYYSFPAYEQPRSGLISVW